MKRSAASSSRGPTASSVDLLLVSYSYPSFGLRGGLRNASLLSDPFTPSTRSAGFGRQSPREPDRPRSACNAPRGIEPPEVACVAALRQLGGNTFDKTVHWRRLFLGMTQNQDMSQRCVTR